MLFSQRLLIGNAVCPHLAVHKQRHQDTGDNGEAGLIGDGLRAGAPGFGLAEVILLGVETFLFLPAAGIAEGDESSQVERASGGCNASPCF